MTADSGPTATDPEPFIVSMICCGTHAGTKEFATWDAADEFRQAWERPSGHDRIGTISSGHPVTDETERCRYCGIEPDQALPRPSYHDLKARYDEALRLLSVPISEMDTAYGAECDAFLSRALSTTEPS